VKVYRDHGVSGAKSRKDRPAFDALWKDATRRKFDVVMAWSVDRLGRTLPVDPTAVDVDLPVLRTRDTLALRLLVPSFNNSPVVSATPNNSFGSFSAPARRARLTLTFGMFP